MKNIIDSFNLRSITVLEDDFNQRKLANHQSLEFNDGIPINP